MPALGDYAGTVLAAYGVTLALVAGLVAASLRRAARVRRALAEVEARMGSARRDDAA
jgi:heme exporter protein D